MQQGQGMDFVTLYGQSLAKKWWETGISTTIAEKEK
jgi:hypothetical protein